MVKWQDAKKLIGGSVGIIALFSALFLLTGVSYTHSGDLIGNESFINVTTDYWRFCFDHYAETKYADETLFKKQTRSRTLHVNLDKINNIISTEPKIEVDWLVPARGAGNWRPIKGGDCWERGKVNKIKLVGHKEADQTVKWSFILGDKIDIDPIWYGEEAYKSYNPESKEITIRDKQVNDIVKITLLTEQKEKVHRGINISVARFEVNSLKALEILISNYKLYDKNNDMKLVDRPIYFKIEETELYQDCNKVIVGGHQEIANNGSQIEIYDYEEVCKKASRTILRDLDKSDFKKDEKIIVNIVTDVYEGDKIEWVLTFEIDGIEYTAEEFAVWEESWNVGVVSAWKMDDASGTILDSVGNGINNGTNHGADYGATGKIGDAMDFEDTQDDVINITDSASLDFTDSMSVSVWIKFESVSSWPRFVWKRGSAESFAIMKDGGSLSWALGTPAVNYGWTPNTGQWYHIVGTFDKDDPTSDDMRLYLDGQSVNNGTKTIPLVANSMNVVIGGAFSSAVSFDGLIDETILWDRAITASEVSGIYAAGLDGNGYTEDFIVPCTFNGTVKDGGGTAINNSRIVIANAEDDTVFGNTTSDVNGLWNLEVNVDGNYTVYAYEPNNKTRAGDIFPYVECIQT